ncbi:tRNA uridine-5-carboxymethylaminomethyl(34) synthesis GTPase MnmE [Buchnera aphidicola (Brachycaudus cardui)]|uniref:tRNA modification GTPase MnmE n=1 Tax=Buchnera aphidicola (Brachycaudus cardui) TaxID=557993 RepID=A0A4D6XRM4_9GAMM|nr:tRNA uridine-5-carboxymethylaminomethyl(34) synthesis GTPase MnmE [Buchnera aphidicola]QCI20182.1 tRNA uridine-5-carboxymethylaminomethyl(34) synthesis GTPase MnmE [Buchnera aphidicola (Brachycaudus cardui)]
MIRNETIVAQITYPGKSAIGVLRISGSKARIVALKILGKVPRARFATYSKFLGQNNIVLDQGIFLWFPSPFSFTGEDVLEFQGHGSPVIMDLLIKRILSIDKLRMARPGEFSERAFLNGKIDLIQAEAIDDLINSETELSIRASLNSLQGDFSRYIQKVIAVLIELRTNIELSIDFSEEDININLNNLINKKFVELHRKFIKIQKITSEGSLLKEGKKIVIIGPPNAGKSSLLNILSCSDRAIVTDIPGTTRDLLYENIVINGISCQLVDTAGLRDTNNKIERLGIIRAWEEIQKSDHILFVMDKTMIESEQKKIRNEFIKNISKNISNNIQITFLLNKNDLVQDEYGIKIIEGLSCINISAKTGQGIDILRNHIINISINSNKESIFIARRRHIKQIDLAYNEFLEAEKNWKVSRSFELLADSLNIIHKFLGEITGQFTSSDLLKHIFSNFCIGK